MKFLELFKWIFLCFLALFLLVLVTAIALPIGLVKVFWGRKFSKGLDDLIIYFKKIAISLDQLGNVSGFKKLDFVFIRPSIGYPFGDEDETISFALGENHKLGTLRPIGRLLYNIINAIDPGHFENLTD